MCEIMTEIDFRMVFDFLREICLGYQIEYKTLESQKFFTPVLVFYPLFDAEACCFQKYTKLITWIFGQH